VHDTIVGGAHDTIVGGAHDSIQGGSDDKIFIGRFDTIVAAAGDSIYGGIAHGSHGPETVGGVGDSVSGFTNTLIANGGHETVTGTAAHESIAGFDTVTGPGHDEIAFAGQNHASIQKVVAGQEVKDGNTTLHLPDGSSMTLIGITHVDASFFKH
jgi:hypothetical protein